MVCSVHFRDNYRNVAYCLGVCPHLWTVRDTDRSDASVVELLLCVRHAAQVAGNLEAATGDCHPKAQWIGEKGIIQQCDARRGMNPKILEYIVEQSKERGLLP